MAKINKQNNGFKDSTSEMKNLFSLIENYQGKKKNAGTKKKLIENIFNETIEFMHSNAVNEEDLEMIYNLIADYERRGYNVGKLRCHEDVEDMREFTNNSGYTEDGR